MYGIYGVRTPNVERPWPTQCRQRALNLMERFSAGITYSEIKESAASILPTGSEEREVLGLGSIPVAILPSCQNMKTIAS